VLLKIPALTIPTYTVVGVTGSMTRELTHFYDSVVTHQTTDSTIVVSSTASKRLD